MTSTAGPTPSSLHCGRHKVRVSLASCAVIGAALLSGCSTPETTPVSGPTWQVTGIFMSEAEPGALPADAAGRAVLAFGDGTVTGNSGCGPIQGAVRFSRDGESASPTDADQVTFEQVTITERKGCEGGRKHVHDQLDELLQGPYRLQYISDSELSLTRDDGAIDSPIIRLTS